MPKPFYGEYSSDEPGEYQAVIRQVINCGHIKNNKDVWMSTVFVDFFIPKLNKVKSLSNFGVYAWLTPNKYPRVGLFELITAVEGRELEPSELKKYDIFSIVEKQVMLKMETINGYVNITGIGHVDAEMPIEGQTYLALGVEDFGNSELFGKANVAAQNLIMRSKELFDGPAVAADAEQEIKVSDIPF